MLFFRVLVVWLQLLLWCLCSLAQFYNSLAAFRSDVLLMSTFTYHFVAQKVLLIVQCLLQADEVERFQVSRTFYRGICVQGEILHLLSIGVGGLCCFLCHFKVCAWLSILWVLILDTRISCVITLILLLDPLLWLYLSRFRCKGVRVNVVLVSFDLWLNFVKCGNHFLYWLHHESFEGQFVGVDCVWL